MKKMIYNYICIGLISCTLVMLISGTVFAHRKQNNIKECVPNQEVAMQIAKLIFESKYEINFDDISFEIELDEENNEWIVWCANKSNGNYVKVGGGLPCIHINRDNATITRLYLQK